MLNTIINLFGEEEIGETFAEKNHVFVSQISDDTTQRFFEEEEEFLEFIKSIEENDEWIQIKIGDLTLHTLNGGGLFSELEIEDKGLVFTPEVTNQIISEVTDEVSYPTATMLAVTDHDTSYLLASSSLSSLTERFGLSCRTIVTVQNEKCPKERFVQFLELAQSIEEVSQNKTLALLRGGKIRTFNSDKYQAISSYQLLQILSDKLSEEFELCLFNHSEWSHQNVIASYSLPTLTEKFVDKYGEEYSEFNPVVVFKTGDLANSSVKIQARLKNKSLDLLIGDLLKVRHLGEKALNLFEKHVSNLYRQFSDRIDQIESLKTLYIDDMVSSYDYLYDKLNFPKRNGAYKAIREDVSTNYGHHSGNAYVLLMYLQKALESIRQTASNQSILLYEENLARQIYSSTWE